MPEQHYLRQFVLLAFALLIPCFALWAAINGWLALPAIGFTNILLTDWLPDIVQGVYVHGDQALLVTRFGEIDGRLVEVGQAGEAIAFLIDHRILSYSMPFYTALHFATPGERSLGSYFAALPVLYALFVVGLVCLGLKDLMLNLGTLFLEHTEMTPSGANAIALLYQLNVLVVPTLAPIMLWAWQSRSTPMLRQLNRLKSREESE